MIEQKSGNESQSEDVIKLLTEDIQSHREYIHRLYRSAFSVGAVIVAIGVGLAYWVLGKQLDARVFEYRIVESLRTRATDITSQIVSDSKNAAQKQVELYINEEIGNEVKTVLKPEIEKLSQETLPEIFDKVAFPVGAILAFDRATGCPQGWIEWKEGAGRTIIGSGQGSGLTLRILGAVGGAETHQLSIEEMPSHSHTTVQMIGDNNIDGVDSTTTRSGDHHNETRNTGTAGEGRAHNNMQPFIVLNYCKKI
ncbi:hypothetical protein MHO82_25200 [Vibrio sp. Of7-15]|uniref:phage tail protein n=1 Tax=Vibrio sp. Of7-15 TaxID=2724879 RepID=UPI001EF28CFD|nr:hypothetical protein [Vibrio sp. Of7-15]MCG7500163.1 hypothetical protein [Vibrio sp. Of7-15]